MTTGSYQYVDANGLLQTVNYVADPVNGFRVAGTNLPVGPAVPETTPLEAPVFDLPVPVAVEDTPEVAAAKAEFQAAFDAAAADAAAERKRRDADEAAVVAAPALAYAGLPYAGLPLAYNTLPAAPVLAAAHAVPHAPVVKSDVITPAEVTHEVAAAPIVTYAHAPLVYGRKKRDADEAVVAAPALTTLPYAGLPLAAGLPLTYNTLPAAAPALTYAAAPAPLAAAPLAPLAAAAPARDAVLTTIKLNPGHATFYRVD